MVEVNGPTIMPKTGDYTRYAWNIKDEHGSREIFVEISDTLAAVNDKGALSEIVATNGGSLIKKDILSLPVVGYRVTTDGVHRLDDREINR